MEQETKKRNKTSDVILIALVILGIVLVLVIGKLIVDGINKDGNYYKLTFDSNGGSEVNPMVAKEGLINLPTNVEKKGYRFVGWIINNELADNPYYVKEDSSFIANWHSDSTVYKINLHLNGGVGNDALVSTTNTLGSLYEPTKEGSVFNGWYTADNQFVVFPCKLSDTNDFYAKWIEDSSDYVTVKFDSGETITSYKVQKNTVMSSPLTPYRLGYELIGWNLNGKKYAFSKPVTENITLKAEWKEKEEKYYVVSFDVNGSDDYIVSQMILEGEKALIPVVPERKGYQFTGWELDGKKYDFDSVVNKDIKLKAQWKSIDKNSKTYIVSFNLNGGKEDIPSQTVLEGGVVSVPSVVPTKDGYTFGGWYYNDELYDFNAVVTSEITLQAKWYSNDSIYYSVIFNFNGGGSTYSELVVSGGKVAKPTDPVRSGYTFCGWYYKDKKYDFNKAVTSNITLTAKWEKVEDKTVEKTPEQETEKEDNSQNDVVVIKYKVTFDYDGGGTNTTVDVTSGSKVSKPADPVRSGYIFNGWYYNDKEYNFNDVVTGNITLVAKWTKKATVKYTVTFNSNNGSTTYQNVESGKKATKIPDPVKKGYTFIGWVTSNRTSYDFNSAVTSNLNLYALWGPSNSTDGNVKWIYVNTPANLNAEKYLADASYGNNLLYKTSFNGTTEFFYSHGVGVKLLNNSYYAIRFFNPNDTDVSLTINGCGAVVGVNPGEVWRQMYDNACTIAGRTYTVKAHNSLLLFQNGNSFILRENRDQTGVAALSNNFEGVINMTSSGELLVASLIFRDLNDTYTAVYNG